MRKEFVFVAASLAIAGSAIAVPQSYSYLRTIDMSPAPGGHATSMLADSTGGLYVADNNDDRIYYFTNPLTDVYSTTATLRVYDAGTDPFGSFSWQGVTFDGTNIFVGGDNGGTSVLFKYAPNATPPTAWTETRITMPAGRYTGPTAVAANTLVAADKDTGSLNFFTISGSAATLANSTAATSNTISQVLYSSALSKIFMSQKLDSAAGGILQATSNGTFGGTSYSGAVNPVADTIPSSFTASTTPLTYQNLAVNAAGQIIGTARNQGTVGTLNHYDLFDVSTAGTFKSPYQTINFSTTPQGAASAINVVLGSAFFTKAGVTYLAVGVERGASISTGQCRIYIFQPTPAAVGDWALYSN